jgi:ATP-dependent protease Clp ATPase subunit
VELDGEVLKADSAKMTGVYYEVQKPVKTFSGKHTITFTALNNKKYRESFNFQPVTLAKPVPEILQRSDLIFEFNGLSPDDLVRVLMTDTSFLSEEINRIDSVKNGRIIITKKELKALSNGPVHMQIIKEYEKEVKNGTKEGGRLSISYGLRREFELTD